MRVTAIVLRNAPEVTLPNGPVPVLQDFDPRKPLGVCHRMYLGRDGHVYGDLELFEGVASGTPAAALREGQLLSVSIGEGNVDPLIPPFERG